MTTKTLCNCGCGEAVKAGNKFVNGHNTRLVGHRKSLVKRNKSPEGRAKNSHGRKGKGTGSNNVHWTGENATVHALHGRIRRAKTRTGVCEFCGKRPKSRVRSDSRCGPVVRSGTDFALRKGRVYTDNPNDYIELCEPCHDKYDRETANA